MKLRILHLEDDHKDADLVRLSLARGGLDCDIHPVSSADAYLCALGQPQFDVILSDSGVPGYDGRAAFAAARAQCPAVPFIVVSGHAQHDTDRTDGTGAPGVNARVGKSDLDRLAPAIRAVLLGTEASASRQTHSDSYVAGMQRLVAVVQKLSRARNLPSIMQIVRSAARELVGADGATFVLRDGEKCFYADEDAIGPLWKGKRFALGACISGWAMLNRQPAVIADVYQDARIAHDAYRPTFVNSLVMTPIRTTKPVGAIGVYWARAHLATREQVQLLTALADSTSVAIESVDLLHNLEQRAAECTNELQRRSAELGVLNRELEAFSYSVAHDLRSPLITIDGFSQVLLERCGSQFDETGRSHLERICSGVRRMHRLINDLLELSKIVRAPMHHTRVNISRMAREIMRDLREAAPKRAAEIVIAEDVVVEGDTGLLRIALENLLSNAWKFSSKAPNPMIEFGTRTDSAGRRICFVRDNGAGFDPRFATNLFSPFQRLHTESQFPGTGVGLATVQRIIHRHAGEIWAEAAVDRGACFSFTLPTA
jgi:signal transduction histidine kinase